MIDKWGYSVTLIRLESNLQCQENIVDGGSATLASNLGNGRRLLTSLLASPLMTVQFDLLQDFVFPRAMRLKVR